MKNQLKQEFLDARLKRITNKIRTLSVILGDVESEEKRSGKEVDDQFVLGKIKKMIDSNNQCLSKKEDPALMDENEYLNSLLPKQLTESELGDIISESNCANVGEVMKYLKTNYPGLYDGKMASEIARSVL